MKKNVLKDINSIQLREKILISIIIVFTLYVLLKSTNIYLENISNQYDYVKKSLEQYADSTKEAIEKYFDNNFMLLEYIASKPDIYNMNWKNQYEYLLDDSEYLDFEYFFIVDLEGNCYYINSNEIKNQSHEPFTMNVLSNKRYITEPFNKEENNVSITTLSASIYRDNVKVGAICGVIDLSEITNKIKSIENYQGESAYIINNYGKYIAHYNMKYVYNNRSIYEDFKSKDEVKLRRILFSDVKILENIDIGDSEYFLYSVPIKYTNWNLIILSKTDNLLEDRVTFNITMIISIIGFCLVVFIGYILMRKSISNLRLAYTDTLTKINNREVYVRVINKLENRFDLRITIIYFDLNYFKILNDTYGHNVGDELLIDFAKILKMTFSTNAVVARTGGDEFIAILIDTTNEEIDNKILEMKELIKIYNYESIHKISMSYGYATREKDEKINLKYICEKADENMYKYKKDKRNLKE